jgi:hypothetical protein
MRQELARRARVVLDRSNPQTYDGWGPTPVGQWSRLYRKELIVSDLRISLSDGGTLMIERDPSGWELVYLNSPGTISYEGYDHMVSGALDTLRRIMLLDDLASV